MHIASEDKTHWKCIMDNGYVSESAPQKCWTAVNACGHVTILSQTRMFANVQYIYVYM